MSKKMLLAKTKLQPSLWVRKWVEKLILRSKATPATYSPEILQIGGSSSL